MPRRLVYLVPGFFGFEKLGRFEYFVHVTQALARHLDASAGWEIVTVPTPPTASLTERARALLDTIEATSDEDTEVHLIGHSSGGLDVRLVATPAAQFDPRAAKLAGRIRSIVTVAAPHRGTPLAAAFDGVVGKGLLALTSRAAAGGLRAATRSGPLVEYLSHIAHDQGLLTQLTPDALDVFNATTPDAPGVRYGSVVASTPGHPQHPLYSALRRLSARMPENRETTLPAVEAEQLAHHNGRAPTWRDSDGIVPSRSQTWGQVVHVAPGDHLDVLGHYDWIRSGAPFAAAELDALWSDVARFLADEPPPVRTLRPKRTRRILFALVVLGAFVATRAAGLDSLAEEALCFALLAGGSAYLVDRFA